MIYSTDYRMHCMVPGHEMTHSLWCDIVSICDCDCEQWPKCWFEKVVANSVVNEALILSTLTCTHICRQSIYLSSISVCVPSWFSKDESLNTENNCNTQCFPNFSRLKFVRRKIIGRKEVTWCKISGSDWSIFRSLKGQLNYFFPKSKL